VALRSGRGRLVGRGRVALVADTSKPVVLAQVSLRIFSSQRGGLKT
jgi:hypothetical protein